MAISKFDKIPKQLILYVLFCQLGLILDGVPGASFYYLQHTKCTIHIGSVIFICIRFKRIICNTLTVQRVE